MKKLITFFGAILFAATILTSCDTCTKECAYCDGTGKNQVNMFGSGKGLPCSACEGDGCWSDQSQIGH